MSALLLSLMIALLPDKQYLYKYASEGIPHFAAISRSGILCYRTMTYRFFLLQIIQYFNRSKKFPFLFRLCSLEILVKQLQHSWCLLKLTVVFRHNLLILTVKPVAFAMINLVHGLCIKLFIIYRLCSVDVSRHFNTNETAASRRISQQILLIACTDK